VAAFARADAGSLAADRLRSRSFA